ncbi:hypothetical protein AKG09_10635 [Neisseria sp. 83E34]|nr:hypothetical protein AKG09_10635 [Neisseria sp. 83E34]
MFMQAGEYLRGRKSDDADYPESITKGIMQVAPADFGNAVLRIVASSICINIDSASSRGRYLCGLTGSIAI